MMYKPIVISVVSHGHGRMVDQLLHDIATYCATDNLHVELTLNVDEPYQIRLEKLPFSVALHRNERPLGFGSNHNAAFRRTQGEYFCVMNPDVRLRHDPFPALRNGLEQKIGLTAPMVINSSETIQSSARELPTPWIVFAKAIGRNRETEYDLTRKEVYPDWIAGICMLIPWHVYQEIGGFDERYRLYYEDVDLCTRLRLRGYDILIVPEAVIVHDGAYSSRSQLKYFVWHLQSMLRFFGSGVFRAALHVKRSAHKQDRHQNGRHNRG